MKVGAKVTELDKAKRELLSLRSKVGDLTRQVATAEGEKALAVAEAGREWSRLLSVVAVENDNLRLGVGVDLVERLRALHHETVETLAASTSPMGGLVNALTAERDALLDKLTQASGSPVDADALTAERDRANAAEVELERLRGEVRSVGAAPMGLLRLFRGYRSAAKAVRSMTVAESQTPMGEQKRRMEQRMANRLFAEATNWLEARERSHPAEVAIDGADLASRVEASVDAAGKPLSDAEHGAEMLPDVEEDVVAQAGAGLAAWARSLFAKKPVAP